MERQYFEAKTLMANKKTAKDTIEWYFLNATGMRMLNGGYARVYKLKLSKKKHDEVYGDLIFATGEVETGTQSGSEEDTSHRIKFGLRLSADCREVRK